MFEHAEPSESGEKPEIILVPGQVEDDASIQSGCVDIPTNDLLRTVRQQFPQGYIIYKPHPDVLAGNRQGAVDDHIIADYADAVWSDYSIDLCIDVSDRICTMTSLCGFEALIRGKQVIVMVSRFMRVGDSPLIVIAVRVVIVSSHSNN